MIYHSVRRTASRSCYLTADSHYISPELLVRPLPSECRLTAIFDSCHSATVMDLSTLRCANFSSMLYVRTKSMFYSTPPTGPSKNPIFSPRLLKVFSEPVWICFEGIQGESWRACLEPRKAYGPPIKPEKRRRKQRRALLMLSCGQGVRTTLPAFFLRCSDNLANARLRHSSQLSTNDLIRTIRSCLSQFEMR